MLKSPFMGEGEGQLCNPSSREAGGTVKGAKRQLVLTSSSNTTKPMAAEEKQLAASLNLVINSKQKKVSCQKQQ